MLFSDLFFGCNCFLGAVIIIFVAVVCNVELEFRFCRENLTVTLSSMFLLVFV